MYLNIVAEMLGEHFPDHIIADIISGMPHMRIGVDSRSASVPCYIVAIQWLELLLCFYTNVTN